MPDSNRAIHDVLAILGRYDPENSPAAPVNLAEMSLANGIIALAEDLRRLENRITVLERDNNRLHAALRSHHQPEPPEFPTYRDTQGKEHQEF